MAFVAVSDVHLGGSFRGIDADYPSAYLCGAAELANEMRQPLVIAGDLFDSNRPDSMQIMQCRTCLQQYFDNQEYLYFIEGQHDLANPPWLIAEYGHRAVCLSGRRINNVGGLNIKGLMHSYNFVESYRGIDTDGVDFLIIHQLLDGLQMRHDVEVSFLEDEFPTKYGYILGDYHDRISRNRCHYLGSWYNYTQEPAYAIVKDNGDIEWAKTTIPPIQRIHAEDVAGLEPTAGTVYVVYAFPYQSAEAANTMREKNATFTIKKRSLQSLISGRDTGNDEVDERASNIDPQEAVRQRPELKEKERNLIIKMFESDSSDWPRLLEEFISECLSSSEASV